MLLRVSAAAQPLSLCGLVDVEQADRDVDRWRRRRRHHLAGCDRVTRQQQMATVTVELLCAKHRAFGHPLAPLERRRLRDGVEIASSTAVTSGASVAAIPSRTDDFPAPLAPDTNSSTSSIIVTLAIDLTPRSTPTP